MHKLKKYFHFSSFIDCYCFATQMLQRLMRLTRLLFFVTLISSQNKSDDVILWHCQKLLG